MYIKEPSKVYNVTLVNPDQGLKKEIQVSGQNYILEGAQLEGLELPYACNTGACVSCTGKILSGKVYHDHNFLKPKEEEAGFVLLCKSYALSDLVILTDQEDAILDL